MSRIVFCEKLKQNAPGLDKPPYPGEMGKKIYEHISKQAWEDWVKKQTMIVNEYRLSMADAQARQFVFEQMEQELFGDGAQAQLQQTPIEKGDKS